MPRTRRNLWLLLAGLVLLVGLTLGMPLLRETQVASALRDGMATGAPFPLDRLADFDWTRGCIIPAGSDPAAVAELLGFDLPGRQERTRGVDLIFFDADEPVALVPIETPAYAGAAMCWLATDKPMVVPGTDAGTPSFTVEATG